MGAPKQDLRKRFFAKVSKSDSCWLWTAARVSKKPNATGSIRINGRNRMAHRVSWELHFGSVPDGMNVLHRCENYLCVRPEHLYVDRHPFAYPRPIPKKDLRERFWAKVDRSGGPEACWPWTGAEFGDKRYGQFWIDGKFVQAHRLSFALSSGMSRVPLPEVVIMHSCDNPPCCNPAHLSAGTQSTQTSCCRAHWRPPTNSASSRRRMSGSPCTA